MSRSFTGQMPGVIGADLAEIDLARFLRDQHITPTSTAFIFTKASEVIALPDAARFAKALHSNGQMLVTPPKIGDLNDPVIAGLVGAYEDGHMSGTRFYEVAGRTWVGRVLDIPPRYGRDQLLAIMVPLDEIEKPITEIRNQNSSLLDRVPSLCSAALCDSGGRLDRPPPRSPDLPARIERRRLRSWPA